MNKEYQMMREFEKAAGNNVRDVPTLMSFDDRTLRVRMILEEVEEFFQAEGSLVKQVDGIIDTMVLLLGTLVQMGVEPDDLFAAVHRANMRKFPEGKKILRPDGKVLKPEGWYGPEPELENILGKQTLCNDPEWAAIFKKNMFDPHDIEKVIAFDFGAEGESWVCVFEAKFKKHVYNHTYIVHSDWDMFRRSNSNRDGLIKENLTLEEQVRIGYVEQPRFPDVDESYTRYPLK